MAVAAAATRGPSQAGRRGRGAASTMATRRRAGAA